MPALPCPGRRFPTGFQQLSTWFSTGVKFCGKKRIDSDGTGSCPVINRVWKTLFPVYGVEKVFLRLPLEGKAKSGRAARLAEQTGFAPNTETFSAVHNISVGCRSHPARSPGVSGGGAALSSLFRRSFLRRNNEAHFAAQSPERAFLAKPFFARAKNGVNSGRRSRKISVDKSKSIDKPSPRRVRPTIHLNHI